MEKELSGNSRIEVNLSILRNNLQVLKSYLSPGVQQMAVVKADAYGHGAVEVARAIKDDVAWFAVNRVEEGIELREAGIETPVLVFGVPVSRAATAYPDYDLTATVSSLKHFDILQEGTEYHLNFDTGMGRLGLRKDEVDCTIKAIEDYTDIRCTGIYSHFATADDPESDKAEYQLQLFESIRSKFKPNLITHMANTGGTAFYPSSQFDMVRNGIGLYGYPPGLTAIEGLQPGIRWESHLAQIKPIKAGETVSYGARWIAPEDGYIGVVPVGYEEGIPRVLSGDLEVAIGNSFYPVVGTVTMNYIMVYLGIASDYKIGQPVELLGESSLTANEWADRSDTIPYEILTGISGKLQRNYIID